MPRLIIGTQDEIDKTLRALERESVVEVDNTDHDYLVLQGNDEIVAKSDKWEVPKLGIWLQGADQAVRWLVQDFIPDEGLVLMSGPQKMSLKTYSAFTLCLSIASGKPIAGFSPCRQAPVLIIEEEGPRAGTRERWRGLCRTWDVNPDELPLYFSHLEGVKLDSLQWQQRIAKKIKEVRPGLVMLDALGYLHNRNENQLHEISVVTDAMKQIRAMGTAVLYLHHTRKPGIGEKVTSPDSRVRGSTVLTALYDVHLALWRDDLNSETVDLVVMDKEKGWRYYDVRWTFENEGDTVLQAKMELIPKGDLVEKDPVTPELWKKSVEFEGPGVVFTESDFVVALGCSGSLARVILSRMKKERLVCRLGKGSFVRLDPEVESNAEDVK